MMTLFDIESYIQTLEVNPSLYEEKSFEDRMEVVDFIEFHVLDEIQTLLQKNPHSDQLIALQVRSEKIRSDLEWIDQKLFEKLRWVIRESDDKIRKFRELIDQYIDVQLDVPGVMEAVGYDNLDLFINGIFNIGTIPAQSISLEPEMVYYQKTPARIVFDFIKKLPFTNNDVFIDLGSGLGQVVILVNLLTGMTSKGIEFEPSYCDVANKCAAGLNLSHVSFIPMDARHADYSQGTIFFMFTPFTGEMMGTILEILRKESRMRKIKIITYGPCTTRVALESWLSCQKFRPVNIYETTVFISI
jgi:hypothetical protein